MQVAIRQDGVSQFKLKHYPPRTSPFCLHPERLAVRAQEKRVYCATRRRV